MRHKPIPEKPRSRFLLVLSYRGKGASLDATIEKTIGKFRSGSEYIIAGSQRSLHFKFKSSLELQEAKKQIMGHPQLLEYVEVIEDIKDLEQKGIEPELMLD